MDWISVENNLPALEQPVLVLLNYPNASYNTLGVVQVANLSAIKGWCNQTGPLKTVSHWMPLPPPPVDEHFEGIKFAADSVVSHYIPADAKTQEFSFNLTSDGQAYQVYYAKDPDGYWNFKSYYKA